MVDIVDETDFYDFRKFSSYIKKSLDRVPAEDVKDIEKIVIRDSRLPHSPAIIRGGYYPPTSDTGAVIHIYIDENLGHMKSFHRRKNLITSMCDALFIAAFGRLFVVATLYHEIGHHVHEMSEPGVNQKDGRAETYATRYENKLFRKSNPAVARFYGSINALYRFIYAKRIAWDNEVGKGFNNVA